MDFRINEGILCKYNGKDETVVIPDGVTAIGERAFDCCWSLKEIIIPGSVTEIRQSAFRSCESLEKVVISDGVKKIESSAFYGCKSLKEIIIPNSVTEIGGSAFYNCSSLEKMVIPNSVTEIGERAFNGCESLQDKNGFLIINGTLFDYFGKDEKAIIPDSVTTIGDCAFNNCWSLKEIIIPSSVTEIERGAFAVCSSLKEINVPRSVTEIGSDAFLRCSSLKEIIIPNSVTEIGERAFKSCESLEKVVIQDGVKKIGESAFESCRSLEKVIIPSSVKTIGYRAFISCSSLEKIIIPDGVKRIERFAFNECKSLKEIIIPSSVAEIGGSAFWNCSSLEKVVIQDGVKTIESSAFYGCKSLKEITIPSSVTEIGDCAFSGCKSLKEIIIPDSVTATGEGAFYNCESLEKVVISDGVKKIGNSAFYRCSSLKEIIIPSSVTEIGERAFNGCKSLEKVFIQDGVKKIGDCAFYNCSSLEKVVISGGVNIFMEEYKELVIKDISDELNKYVNTTTKALLYFDSIDELKNLNYKTDLCNYPNIIIRGYENIEITDKERKIILSELKKRCSDDDRLYIPLAFFADDDTVNELVDNINIWMKGKKKDKERIMRVKGALLLNDTISAQKYFEKIDKLDIYAKKRNLDVDDLQDQLLSDFGLDHDGKTEYALEDNTVTVSLQNDLKFILTDNTGKVIKSISKKTDKGIKANEEYSKLKKDVKEAAKMVNNKLFKDFLSGKSRDGISWSNIWLNNPVMKIMARLIVWQQDGNTFTLHDDNKAYLVDNTPYEISNEPVSVAHPLEMKEDELIKWRQYFIDNSIKQPFEQVWEPVCDPNSIKPDRYKDAYIPLYVIMNKDKHGIIMKGQSELSLKDCSATLELIESHSDWINNQFEITNFRFNKYTRYVNHIVSIFDKGTVEDRIRKDDISVSIYLDRFTLAQITDFIDIATKNKCTNVSALLLQHKHDHYPDYDHIDELILDL